MIPVGWEEVAALRLGALHGAVPDSTIRRIHADSREARPADLFVALNTGVGFVDDALARGAAALVPDDQQAALAALATLRADAIARAHRCGRRLHRQDDDEGRPRRALCAAVTPTVYPSGSLNNEIGLPLTVLRLEPETEVLVAEMGMRGLGQIAGLCRIAPPIVTLVTSIGPEHLEVVGTVAEVARANAEAIEALPAGGVAVVPAGVPELEPFLGRGDIDVRRFDPATVERVGTAWQYRVEGKSSTSSSRSTSATWPGTSSARSSRTTPSGCRSTVPTRGPVASRCRAGAAR